MSAPETQNDSGPIPTTGHEWDGIRELDKQFGLDIGSLLIDAVERRRAGR